MAARSALTTSPWTPAVRGRSPRQVSVWALVRRVFQVVTTRQMLMEMDSRMLADIGLSRSEALTEANRAPWDLHEVRHRR